VNERQPIPTIEEIEAVVERRLMKGLFPWLPNEIAADILVLLAEFSDRVGYRDPETIRAAEREACAKIADEFIPGQSQRWETVRSKIASRIRARSETGRKE